MRRPRVFWELGTYLGILIRAGLRSGVDGDQGPMLLESPRDIEGEGPASMFFLEMYRVAPEKRASRATALAESMGEAREGLRLEMRHPPLWVACRYLVAVRGKSREDEAEMVAALLRTLNDHPLISSEHLPSVRALGPLDRYPLEILDDREAWREAGLSRPRLSIAFQVIVPIHSALSDPVDRVLDREIRVEEMG